MKSILIFIFISLLFSDNCIGREKGWVPLPKSSGLKTPSSVKATFDKSQKINTIQNKKSTIYDNQPVVTEKELLSFLSILPQFRSWAKKTGEQAHPILSEEGRPDFLYSQNAAKWVNNHNFEAKRFFNIMGKMAAGMVILEDGNDFSGTRPKDMPEVTQTELELVNKHINELQKAGQGN